LAEVKLSADALRLMSLFENQTGVMPKDCLLGEDDERVVIVVNSADMGRVIGRNGININRVSKTFDKSVEVIEYTDDVEQFVKNTLQPANVKRVRIQDWRGRKVAVLDIPAQERGIAIGRNGRNIAKAKKLVLRHHGLEDIIINERMR